MTFKHLPTIPDERTGGERATCYCDWDYTDPRCEELNAHPVTD